MGHHEHDHDHGEQQSLPGMEGYTMPEPPEATEALTAFLVVCYPDGRKTAISDVNTPLKLEREATLNDMYDGAGQVQRDVTLMISSGAIVNQTINGMMQAMAYQAEQARQSKIEHKLMEKGIRVPGR